MLLESDPRLLLRRNPQILLKISSTHVIDPRVLLKLTHKCYSKLVLLKIDRQALFRIDPQTFFKLAYKRYSRVVKIDSQTLFKLIREC